MPGRLYHGAGSHVVVIKPALAGQLGKFVRGQVRRVQVAHAAGGHQLPQCLAARPVGVTQPAGQPGEPSAPSRRKCSAPYFWRVARPPRRPRSAGVISVRSVAVIRPGETRKPRGAFRGARVMFSTSDVVAELPGDVPREVASRIVVPNGGLGVGVAGEPLDLANVPVVQV